MPWVARCSFRFFRSAWFWTVPVLFGMIGTALILSSIFERLRTGGTQEHWSRYVVMTFWLSNALILSVTRIIDYCITLVAERMNYLSVQLPTNFQLPESKGLSLGRIAAVRKDEDLRGP